jgi:predicted GNAT family acetyltransferase
VIAMSDVSVRDNGDESRFEAYVDGELAGFSAYDISDGVVTLTHTEIDDAFEGQGVGSALVRQALDQVRANGELRVRPRCPFVRAWIEHHPDYQDLLQGPR